MSYGDGPAKELWEKAGITGWYFADRDEPVAATVTRMAALPFDAQPGEKYVYGYSTDILGVVVERASGMPLDELLRTPLFEPLKMNDTHFYLPPAKADRLATVYSADARRQASSARPPREPWSARVPTWRARARASPAAPGSFPPPPTTRASCR